MSSVTFEQAIALPVVTGHASEFGLEVAPWGFESSSHWRIVFGRPVRGDHGTIEFVEQVPVGLLVDQTSGMASILLSVVEPQLVGVARRTCGETPPGVRHLWIV